MSKSLIRLYWDQILAKQLEMIRAPLDSGERFVLIQDIAQIKETLAATARA